MLTIDRFKGKTTSLIKRYSVGFLAIAQKVQQEANPFLDSHDQFQLIAQLEAANMRQLTSKQVVDEFGDIDAEIYFVKVVSSIPIQTGCYALANFSGQAKVSGIIERVDLRRSGVVDVFINASRQVPLDMETIFDLRGING